MKQFVRILGLLVLPILALGQSKSLNYQAVIMDPKPIEIPGTSITGQPLKKGKVDVRFVLLSQSGSVDYEEFHQATTDEYGLINLTIGKGLIGSASGLSTQATTATYRSFDAVKWDSNVKQLRVDLSFDSGKSYHTASVQPFNYMAYALYAESVEYKNVRESPKTLSYFQNDMGFIVNKDLDPLKLKIDQNEQDAISKFLIIHQSISENEKIIAQNAQKLGEINLAVLNQENKLTNQETLFENNKVRVQNQITSISDELSVTRNKVDAALNNYEQLANKSLSIQDDRLSNNKYPSVKAVKEYVDQATMGIALQASVDSKEDKQNKSGNIKTDPNPNVNYPSVSAVKQYVLESSLGIDTQLIIDGKENVSNKSSNVLTDAGSDNKYPSVKAVKAYVDNATIHSLTVERQAISLNDAKNVISLTGGESSSSITLPNATSSIAGLIQLSGDLGGSSESPTVPDLALKENTINKVDVIENASNAAYPTTNAVMNFVSNTINSSKTGNATTVVNGIIRLAGDLTGTADEPLVKADAITTVKILDENVTDPKIKSMSATKLTGLLGLTNGGTGASSKTGARENLDINLVDNTSDLNKPISIAAQSEIDRQDLLITTNKTTQEAKNQAVDLSIASQASQILAHQTSITANATAITLETNTRKAEITRDSTAIVELTNRLNSSISTIQTTLNSGVSAVGSSLAMGKIIVGNASDIAAAVSMSGDVTINQLGSTSINSNAIGSTEISNGSIANEDLMNNSFTIGTSQLELGGTYSILSGLAEMTATTFNGSLNGNANSASKLTSAKTIGMTGDVTWTSAGFDGTANVSGISTIGAGKVTNEMLAGDIDLSTKVIGGPSD